MCGSNALDQLHTDLPLKAKKEANEHKGTHAISVASLAVGRRPLFTFSAAARWSQKIPGFAASRSRTPHRRGPAINSKVACYCVNMHVLLDLCMPGISSSIKPTCLMVLRINCCMQLLHRTMPLLCQAMLLSHGLRTESSLLNSRRLCAGWLMLTSSVIATSY
jgi:hypothetical protein